MAPPVAIKPLAFAVDRFIAAGAIGPALNPKIEILNLNPNCSYRPLLGPSRIRIHRQKRRPFVTCQGG